MSTRDAAAREPAVGLELRLARAARADAAAEALEVLPHAPHARQVVLELRELDLELPLGAHGVLGEDVEDQLRAVDHARLSSASSRKRCCDGIELVVDEQALGLGVGEALLQLLELALADVGALRRPGAVLDDAADRLDARRARELLDLRELVVGIRSLGQHREDEPALRLRRSRNVESSGDYARLRSPGSDLAARTLALVDIAVAVARRGARSTDYVKGNVPLDARLRRRRVACSTRSGAGRPLVLLAGHTDTVPAAGQPARPDRGRRGARARRDAT